MHEVYVLSRWKYLWHCLSELKIGYSHVPLLFDLSYVVFEVFSKFRVGTFDGFLEVQAQFRKFFYIIAEHFLFHINIQTSAFLSWDVSPFFFSSCSSYAAVLVCLSVHVDSLHLVIFTEIVNLQKSMKSWEIIC